MKSIGHFIFSLLLLCCFSPRSAEAIRIQILHTNDLHASLLTTGAPRDGQSEYGGWAQVKTIMDQLTDQAAHHVDEHGYPDPIETVRLDAGDFFEGTMDYFPDSGKNIVRAFQSMGYDASTLGNHDWLMGARSLDEVLGELPFSVYPNPGNILSANLKISKELPNLRQQIVPHINIVRGGLKISVFGLSTDEAFYKWITRINSRKSDLKIKSYFDSDPDQSPDDEDYDPGIATQQINQLREKDNLVIALTHIGYDNDKKLAATTRGLDLIIGGHSHTILDSWTQVDDLDGNSIPIVQTGVNGRYVGRIMVDYEPGQRPVVSTYELVEVPHETTPDAKIAALVKKSEDDLKQQYPNIDEVIGQTDVRLTTGDRGPSAFGKFAVNAMQAATGADVAIDIGDFHGVTAQPAGNVTRRNLMEMYPRKFEVTQNEGLYVYTTSVAGWVLKLAIQTAIKYGYYLSIAGLHYQVERISDADYNKIILAAAKKKELPNITPYRATSISVDNKGFCDFCKYRVALPESFLRGIYAYSALTKLVLTDGERTNVTIWDAMINYLKQIKTIHALTPEDRKNGYEFTLPSDERMLDGEEGDAPTPPWVKNDFSMDSMAESLLHGSPSK